MILPNTQSLDSANAWMASNTSGNAALISSNSNRCHSLIAFSIGPSIQIVSLSDLPDS